MSCLSEKNDPIIQAQKDYDQHIKLLQNLYNNDKFSIEVAGSDYLGDNSLKLLLNKFGEYDAGWLDDIELNDIERNRLLTFTRQEVVSTNAITKSTLKKLYKLEKSFAKLQWFLVILVLLNIIILVSVL